MALDAQNHARALRGCAIVMLLLAAAACDRAEPYDLSAVPVVRDYAGLEARLDAAAAKTDALTMTALGAASYDGFAARLWHVAFEPAGGGQGRMLVTAGIHGNEPAGVEAVARFIERLAGEPEAGRGVAIDFVPVVNPWGWACNRRRNPNNRDLNRDFATFAEQESRLMREFTAGCSYDVMLDLHEDGSATGFYVYQLANEEDALIRAIVAAQEAQGYRAEQEARMAILRARDGVIKAPAWTLVAAQLGRQLSMANYWRLAHCGRSFLFETPSALPMDDRAAMHAAGLDRLLGTVRGD